MNSSQNGVAPLAGDLFTLVGSVEPTRLSLAYRTGLLVVAAAMLLLPVLYVAIIALAGFAVWWHLTSNLWLMEGSGTQWRLIAYLAPAVVGTVVMFFMVKPLLARPSRGIDPIRVDPEDEPLLFAFIQQICGQVRAPMPRRVQVDCQVNASAGFLRGVFSRDLVLTIGLPLVAGLSVRELGGVLAHEFGHFAQGGGMRLTAIVRGTNAWFARVVYERDRWDDALARWSKDADWRLSIVLGLARVAVWLSRRVLTGLMWAGHAISCFMMRQMEYDADSYEIKFSGSQTFARTSGRLRELGLASRYAYGDLGDGLNAGTLPSNLPAYVADRVARLPAELADRVRNVPEGKTGLFDTHPSDADRIRAADAAAAPGILEGGEGSAIGLFSRFEALCAMATRHHYEHDLGLSTGAVTLVSPGAAASEARRREDDRRAVQTVFGSCLSAQRPLRVRIDAGADLASLVAASAAARAGMDALATDALASQYRQIETLERRRMDAFTVELLHSAGFPQIDAASFGLASGTREEAARTHAAAAEQQRALAPALAAFEDVSARRLSTAVALGSRLPTGADGLSGAVTSSDTIVDPASLIDAFNALAAVVPHAVELRALTNATTMIESNQESSPEPALTRRCLAHLGQRIQNELRRMHDRLDGVALPPALGSEAATLAAFCGSSGVIPPEQAPLIIDRVWALYFDLLGRLARTALETEERMGAQTS